MYMCDVLRSSSLGENVSRIFQPDTIHAYLISYIKRLCRTSNFEYVTSIMSLYAFLYFPDSC